MKKIAMLLLLVWFVSIVGAQSAALAPSVPYTQVAAYGEAMEPFSIIVNPAAAAGPAKPQAGFYTERKFMLRELSNFLAAFTLPTRLGGLGLCIQYFGFENFNTTVLSWVYARKLGKSIELGCGFKYHLMHAGAYGNAHALTGSLGMRWRLTDKLRTGFSIDNAVGGSFGPDAQEKLPALYSVGLGYQSSPDLLVNANVVKEEDQRVSISVAMEYNYERKAFGRLGITSGTTGFFCGLGVAWHKIQFDVAINWQFGPGITPGLMMLIGDSSAGTSGDL